MKKMPTFGDKKKDESQPKIPMFGNASLPKTSMFGSNNTGGDTSKFGQPST